MWKGVERSMERICEVLPIINTGDYIGTELLLESMATAEGEVW